jgi:hypothetical protein
MKAIQGMGIENLARNALGRAALALLRVAAVETDVAALQGVSDWRGLTVAAAAATYFTLEDLGSVGLGEVWVIEATVAAGKKPSAAATTRQSSSLQLQGSVTRATGGPAPVAFYTTALLDGGALVGWSTGVRLVVVGSNVELQGRVTTADTIQVRWRRSVERIVIA